MIELRERERERDREKAFFTKLIIQTTNDFGLNETNCLTIKHICRYFLKTLIILIPQTKYLLSTTYFYSGQFINKLAAVFVVVWAIIVHVCTL